VAVNATDEERVGLAKKLAAAKNQKDGLLKN